MLMKKEMLQEYLLPQFITTLIPLLITILLGVILIHRTLNNNALITILYAITITVL